MLYLTIIRHAKSSWEFDGLDDLVRPLNERGRATLELISDFISGNKIHPDLIYTSPATRALHTALTIANAIKYPTYKLKIDATIYFGNATTILTQIKNTATLYKHLFIVGHEPILSEIIERTTNTKLEKFPTGAIATIRFNNKQWNAIEKGQLIRLVTPKELVKNNIKIH